MNGARLDLALAILAVSLGGVAVRRTAAAVSPGVIPLPVITRAPGVPGTIDADSMAIAESTIIEHDLFRLANRPASVPFTIAPMPNVAPGARSAPPPEPRPVLTLRAIMGGPPWFAVVEGLPGQPASVTVRAGDSFGRLVVRSIARDTVVVQAPDTTWKLTLTRRQ